MGYSLFLLIISDFWLREYSDREKKGKIGYDVQPFPEHPITEGGVAPYNTSIILR